MASGSRWARHTCTCTSDPARPGPARQHPAGTGRRSRSVGEVASLCLLDADPEVTHPHDMPRMTLLDGRVVHRVD